MSQQQRRFDNNQVSGQQAHTTSSLSAGFNLQSSVQPSTRIMHNGIIPPSGGREQVNAAGDNHSAARQNEWYRASEDRNIGQLDQQYYNAQHQIANASRQLHSRLPHHNVSSGSGTTHDAANEVNANGPQLVSQQQGKLRVATTYPSHVAMESGSNTHQQQLSHSQHGGERPQVTTSESVVRFERGEERLISVTERVDETRSQVINERILEHEVRIPKKIIREEVIERMIVVPEKVMREEVVDDVVMVQEKVIEVAKPTIIEKVIEVPEIEYVEKPVYEHIKKVEERRVPVEVERVIHREKEWEPEYRKVVRRVPVEVVVDEVVYEDTTEYREVKGPDNFVRRPVEKVVVKERATYQDRRLPVPLEAEAHYDFHLNKFKPIYSRVNYPVYLPRFIEVPVPSELMTAEQKQKALQQIAEVDDLTRLAASLCEVETTAATTMQNDLTSIIRSHTNATAAGSSAHLHHGIIDAWKNGNIQINDVGSNTLPAGRPATGVSQPFIGSTDRATQTNQAQQPKHYQQIYTNNQQSGGLKQTHATPAATSANETQLSTDNGKYNIEQIKNQVRTAAASFQADYTGAGNSYVHQGDRQNVANSIGDPQLTARNSNKGPSNTSTAHQGDGAYRKELSSDKRSYQDAFDRVGKSALVR